MSDAEQLIQELGDFCHQYYQGCTQDEYAYSDEVINLLDKPGAREIIKKHLQPEPVDGELEPNDQAKAWMNSIGYVLLPNGMYAQFDQRSDYYEQISKNQAWVLFKAHSAHLQAAVREAEYKKQFFLMTELSTALSPLIVHTYQDGFPSMTSELLHKLNDWQKQKFDEASEVLQLNQGGE